MKAPCSLLIRAELLPEDEVTAFQFYALVASNCCITVRQRALV
jgi:hypothetical protein